MNKANSEDPTKNTPVDEYPGKIVSLCPSITETLIKLGLKDRIAGRTDYCYRPEGETEEIPKVGGPKDIDPEKIDHIKPDLIIAIKEENNRQQIEQLQKAYMVFVFDITTYTGALDMIIRLGELTGKQQEAVTLSDQIDNAFARIPQLNTPRSFLYLVWKDPLMAAGKRTYINNLLTSHGFVNCLDTFAQRYVTLNFEVFKKLEFELAFLPGEPYKFTAEDKKDILAFFPQTDIRLIDGEVFTWYGYRMLHSAEYIKNMIEEMNTE
ncbi:MAG: helical backbone metal receptor [Bacteroidales bacterium]